MALRANLLAKILTLPNRFCFSGKKILGKRHVQPSVPYLLPELMIEATFKDGTFLVTVYDAASCFHGSS